MNHLKIIILLVFLAFNFNISNACSCGGSNSFCDNNFLLPNQNVFIGEIIRHDSLYTEFKILDRLRGVELRDTIKIWDNPIPANLCYGYFEKDSRNLGSVGDSLLIILPKVDSVNAAANWGTVGDYYKPLAFCSTEYIRIQDSTLIGNLTITDRYNIPGVTNKPDTVSINFFKANYSPTGRAHDCNLYVGLKSIDNSNDITIYPNPSDRSIQIESTAAIKNIQLFKSDGREVVSRISIVSKRATIDVEDLSAGIYLIRLYSKDGHIITRRIIKR